MVCTELGHPHASLAWSRVYSMGSPLFSRFKTMTVAVSCAGGETKAAACFGPVTFVFSSYFVNVNCLASES